MLSIIVGQEVTTCLSTRESSVFWILSGCEGTQEHSREIHSGDIRQCHCSENMMKWNACTECTAFTLGEQWSMSPHNRKTFYDASKMFNYLSYRTTDFISLELSLPGSHSKLVLSESDKTQVLVSGFQTARICSRTTVPDSRSLEEVFLPLRGTGFLGKTQATEGPHTNFAR